MMALSRNVDLLEPVNLAEHLEKVELYLGQVCQIAGISKMQLDYWTNKAQIPTKGKKQRIYDMDALETVMLIKQAKDKGLNLGAAIEAARRFREQEHDAGATQQYPPQPRPAVALLEERLDQVDRRREDDRAGVRAADLQERLQVAQLQRDRMLLDHERRVFQPLRRLVLTLGVDDLRAPLALGLRLPRHGALHAARDLDVLHLDDRDLDPPRGGCLVDDLLQDGVDLVALRQQLVERVLTEHRAQGRLRDLRGRDHEVLDLHDRVLRLDDPEVRDRVHAHRDVVLRDHVLRRDVQGDRPQVDLDHPIDDRDEQEEAGALRIG